MTPENQHVQELEERLTEPKAQWAQGVAPYAEDDDVITQALHAPLGDQEWVVQLSSSDRRMLPTSQLIAELRRGGSFGPHTLVWRGGMEQWLPVAAVPELAVALAPPPPAAASAAPRALPRLPPPPQVPGRQGDLGAAPAVDSLPARTASGAPAVALTEVVATVAAALIAASVAIGALALGGALRPGQAIPAQH